MLGGQAFGLLQLLQQGTHIVSHHLPGHPARRRKRKAYSLLRRGGETMDGVIIRDDKKNYKGSTPKQNDIFNVKSLAEYLHLLRIQGNAWPTFSNIYRQQTEHYGQKEPSLLCPRVVSVPLSDKKTDI
ncbi:hypothetical protein DsansV1_C03g0036001 [Dioscorea sansibarensis]